MLTRRSHPCVCMLSTPLLKMVYAVASSKLRRNLGCFPRWVSLMNGRARGATSLDMDRRSHRNFIMPLNLAMKS